MAGARLTIRLDQRLRNRLGRLAKSKGRATSDLVREAIEEYCRDRKPGVTCYDVAVKMGLIGAARDLKLPPDLSTNPKYMEGFGTQ